VAVVIAPASAALTSTQHTAWMAINLLARCEGVVSAIRLVCPAQVPVADHVVPLAPRRTLLRDALLAGAQAIGAVPINPAPAGRHADITLVVGTGASPVTAGAEPVQGDRIRYVCGDGWWGGVSDSPITVDGSNPLPFGPYIAACLVVAEVFLAARLPQHVSYPTGSYGWDSWSQRHSPAPDVASPANCGSLDLTGTTLAGVGAVGTTWVHTLWAVPELHGTVALVDDDREGVTTTNLNRCPLLGADSIGKPKAQEAARISAASTITWKPRRGRFQDSTDVPTVLISAVDTNRARAALQQRYAPCILSASTRELRAEVLRVGPPGIGACLRCYNPPEPVIADDALRQHALAGGADAVEALARESGVEREAVEQWLSLAVADAVRWAIASWRRCGGITRCPSHGSPWDSPQPLRARYWRPRPSRFR
jgi:molybdopterin/thiamine biosynthesis adenylyltransferase